MHANFVNRLLVCASITVLSISLAARHSSLAAASWTLTWSDEFNSPDNSTPDPKKWAYDLGGSGWGNHELESYTSRPENVKIVGGNLVIGKADFSEVENLFRTMGFDRVFPPSVDLSEVAALLKADILGRAELREQVVDHFEVRRAG